MVADAGYRDATEFRLGLTYVLAVSPTATAHPAEAVPVTPAYRGNGRPPLSRYPGKQWEEETGNDQLKTHLRSPGKVLRSRLPDLVYREIWAYLILHHAISALIAKASAAANPDLDLDRISFTKAMRLIRRTATGTAGIPPQDWPDTLPAHLARIATLLIPTRPRAVKRARHNNYRVKKPDEPASTRHHASATINMHTINPTRHDQLTLTPTPGQVKSANREQGVW